MEDAAAPRKRYAKQSGGENVRRIENMHDGVGSVDVQFVQVDAAPARFLVAEFAPGASEGVHAHRFGDPDEKPYDEFYYIVSGEGRMVIDDENIPVRAGDHIHTPLGVPHGIENTHPTDTLRILLTYIDRT